MYVCFLIYRVQTSSVYVTQAQLYERIITAVFIIVIIIIIITITRFLTGQNMLSINCVLT